MRAGIFKRKLEATKNNAWALQLGSSAVRGYIIDGEDGMETQVIGNVANQAVGHAVGYVRSGFNGPESFNRGVYVYNSNKVATGYNWLDQNLNRSVSIGGAATIEYGQWNNSQLITHEIEHFTEQNTLGASYIPAHLLTFGALEHRPYHPHPEYGGYH